MSSLINRCSQRFSKEDMAHTEELILSSLNFDMAFSDTAFSLLAGVIDGDKLEDGEKLLGLAVTERDIMKMGD